MCRLGNGVACVPDIFGVECPIKLDTFVHWNLITQWVVATGGNDLGSEEGLYRNDTVLMAFGVFQTDVCRFQALDCGLGDIPFKGV